MARCDAVLNPLTALWGVQNRVVLERAEGLHIAREVVREVSALALALGARGLSRSAPSSEELLHFVAACAAENGENWSSMHQDVTKGRLTEVEQLNGWVSAKANALGLRPMVHNEWLTRCIRERQSQVYAQLSA